MNVIAIGPLPVGSLVWQGHANRVLTIACKATFILQPGESPLSPGQQPLNPDDAYLEDEPSRSMQAPSDLVPFKARVDVVLVGYAFAPRGEPVRSLVVRLVVGQIDKAFEVFGDRAWTMSGALREGPPFTRLSLRYERAGGGPATANPIGVNPDAMPDAQGMIPLPNLQPVGFAPSRRGEVIEPVGFGPLSDTWSGRREQLGWLAPPERWDTAPLPAEIDPAYFNCAPRDQQMERLREDERLVLENLHPQHPLLVTNLPGVRPRAFADLGDGIQEIAMAADTLWIDTGAGICTVTWRGYVENPPPNGNVVVAMDHPGLPLPWAEVQSAARAGHALPFLPAITPAAADSGLPFAPQAGAPPSRPRMPTLTEATHLEDLVPGSLRQELAPPSSASAEARLGSDGLPFAKAIRAPEPPVTTYSEPSPPGDASPAWLQGRSAPSPGKLPVVPSPAVPWPFAPSALRARALIEGVRYEHTNLIAHDVNGLVLFYEEVFGCTKVPPPRDQSGEWLERATRVPRAHLRGHHLRLPGHGPEGPTLEIYAYDEVIPQGTPAPNRAGFGHLAFSVADVERALATIVQAGGSALGEVVRMNVAGAGALCFTYARDPEGNILELQRWSR